jgi:hypothetical protein
VLGSTRFEKANLVPFVIFKENGRMPICVGHSFFTCSLALKMGCVMKKITTKKPSELITMFCYKIRE